MMHGTIHVALICGRSVQIAVTPESSLQDVKLQAQSSLQIGPGILLDAHGEVLNMHHTVSEAGVSFGAVLTLHTRQTAVARAAAAFAAILGDGSVVTWGTSSAGGDSSTVQHQLRNVKQIQSTDHAFAALLGYGSAGAILSLVETAAMSRIC